MNILSLVKKKEPNIEYIQKLNTVDKGVILTSGIVNLEVDNKQVPHIYLDNNETRIYLNLSIDSLLVILTNLKNAILRSEIEKNNSGSS